MGVNYVDFVFLDVASEAESGSGIDLESRTAVDDVEILFDRPSLERLARARGHDRDMTSMGKLARQPERLSLATSPSAFGIDMQHPIVHGAQLPWTAWRTQASLGRR
jgi:hypothetical protein